MATILDFVIAADENARQEGTFCVPSACDRLYLRHNLSQEYTFLVFLLLKEPGGGVRFLKQLGHSEPIISLGKTAEETTIGGVPGALPAGEWTLTVFLFAEYLARFTGGRRVPFAVEISCRAAGEGREAQTPDAGGVRITEHIGADLWTDGAFCYDRFDFRRITQEGLRWYKGDFHAHTRLSDGYETPERVTEKAALMGLDFYTPTEHNTLHTGWPRTDVLILPGVEITTTLGHANLFGVDRMPRALERILGDKEEALLSQDWQEILAECGERGWLFSVNHPFLHIWKWLWRELPLSAVDCLEIINDPTYAADPEGHAQEANEKAVALSDLLAEDGWRICAIGGSDSHKRIDDFYPGAREPSIAGDPATYVWMKNLSPAHILEALRGCRAYVTRHCRIESDIPFGGRIPEGMAEICCQLELSGQYEKPQIFYRLDGVRHACEVKKTGDGSWGICERIRLKPEGYQCLRFGAEAADGSFLFYGNPLTRGGKEPTLHTFGEAAEELERRMQQEAEKRQEDGAAG